MICRECGLDKLPSNFYADNCKPRGRVARCKKCYQAKQRVSRTGPRRRFHEAKSNAIRRGFGWELTFEQYVIWIANGNCFYCGEPNCNGIDRLNNEPYYGPMNTVTCCGPCNQMKSSLTMRDFMDRVRKIATKCELIETANAAIALKGKV